jgi:hypothetical protein
MVLKGCFGRLEYPNIGTVLPLLRFAQKAQKQKTTHMLMGQLQEIVISSKKKFYP